MSTEFNQSAKDVASYLIKEHNCSFSNNFDGNMKLQKMLVNSNLIHLIKTNSLLFDDEMYAFKNGIVVESVRKPFHAKYNEFNDDIREHEEQLTEEQKQSIDLSFKLFYHLSASELSDLHHELETWKNCYDRSLMGENYYHKASGLIKSNDVVQGDLDRLASVISSFEKEKNEYNNEVVNGITFFYDPEEIVIDDSIIQYLEDVSRTVKSEDAPYFLTTDEDLGVYFY